MTMLTKYGSLYGWAPQTTGNIYYIAPAASYTIQGQSFLASDDNDGLSPERALRTLNRFVALATANAGDVAILLAGTHTVTATQTISKAGLTILGAGMRWEDLGPALTLYPTILSIVGTDDELLNITASNTEFGFLTLRPQTGYSAISFQTTGALEGLRFHHFNIDMTTRTGGNVSLGTVGLDFSNRAGGTGMGKIAAVTAAAGNATAYVWHMGVVSDGAQGAGVLLATCHVHIRDARLHNNSGTWASPFQVATNTDNTTLERVVWTTSGTMTTGLSSFDNVWGTIAADAITLIDSRFGFTTDDIEGFEPGQINVLVSYEPTSGGTLSVIS